jgi:hypothetical protein
MIRILLLFAALCLATTLFAPAPGAPPAQPLLQGLVGHWTMKGKVGSKPVIYRMDATWTLQRAFVELHMVDVEHTPPGYEARVFVGPDTLRDRLVTHWLDNTGAAFSVPAGSGEIHGDTLTLDFPYPAGAFHDSFVLDRTRNVWSIRLDEVDGKGGWKRFAEYLASRR